MNKLELEHNQICQGGDGCLSLFRTWNILILIESRHSARKTSYTSFLCFPPKHWSICCSNVVASHGGMQNTWLNKRSDRSLYSRFVRKSRVNPKRSSMPSTRSGRMKVASIKVQQLKSQQRRRRNRLRATQRTIIRPVTTAGGSFVITPMTVTLSFVKRSQPASRPPPWRTWSPRPNS